VAQPLLAPAFAQDSAADLARILRDKGITNSDLEKLESSPSAERVRALASLLEAKWLLSAAEVATVIKSPAAVTAVVQPQTPVKSPEAASTAPAVTSQTRFQ